MTARRFVADEDGATAIEYGLIAGLIAVALLTRLDDCSAGNVMAMFDYVRDRSADSSTNVERRSGRFRLTLQHLLARLTSGAARSQRLLLVLVRAQPLSQMISSVARTRPSGIAARVRDRRRPPRAIRVLVAVRAAGPPAGSEAPSALSSRIKPQRVAIADRGSVSRSVTGRA